MFSLDTVDVGIGLALLFLILSLLCTSIREAIEAGMKSRASDLERGIRQLLQDDGELTQRLYQHPLIYSLFAGDYQRPDPKAIYRRGGDLPSYIPSNQFARALLDMVHQGAAAYSPYGAATPPLTLASVRAAATQFPNPQIRRAVLSAIDHAHGDLNAARRNLESWFDGTMDRVSGWYKRRTQLILFLIGLVLAVALNIDALTVVQRLQRDKVLRAALVGSAEILVKDAKTAADLADKPEALAAKLGNYGFPIGWPAPQMELRDCREARNCTWTFRAPAASPARTYVLTPGKMAQMLIGWLLTAVAMMLGAPFWFDVLNRMMVIRSTVKPTEKSPDEGSEDRPKSKGAPADADDDARDAKATGPAREPVAPSGAANPAATASTPGGFPFIPNKWKDEAEEGLL